MQQYSIPSIPPAGTLEKTEYQGSPIGVLAEQFFLEDGWKTSEIYRQAKDSQNLTRMTVSMCAYLDVSNNTFARFNASATSKAYHNEGWRNQFEEWRKAHIAKGCNFHTIQ